jgi:hypothetical protein
MSFFEPPPPPPAPPPAPPLPDWFGPRENVLPGVFPLELVLARTGELALYAHNGRAFPNGWEFTFGIRTREPRDGRRHDPFNAWHRGDLDDDVVRVGFELPDGRKATVFDRPRWPEAGDAPPEAVLRQGGGGGGGSGWEFRFWAWPLPPEGTFELVVEWPKEGIPLTRTALDAAPIRAAASRAQELWPEAPPPAGAWTRYA